MGMKPRHKGRSYWGGVQAPSQFSPLLPAPCSPASFDRLLHLGERHRRGKGCERKGDSVTGRITFPSRKAYASNTPQKSYASKQG